MSGDASAARTPISVHLTPFAPGCATLAIDNPKRWRTFYGKSLDHVARSVLSRLNLAPGAVRVAASPAGDVDLLALPPGEATQQPYATVWDGVTEAELARAIADLSARGWKPAAPLPAAAA